MGETGSVEVASPLVTVLVLVAVLAVLAVLGFVVTRLLRR
jgi:hypothetical protein